jgi:hypothetical protein
MKDLCLKLDRLTSSNPIELQSATTCSYNPSSFSTHSVNDFSQKQTLKDFLEPDIVNSRTNLVALSPSTIIVKDIEDCVGIDHSTLPSLKSSSTDIDANLSVNRMLVENNDQSFLLPLRNESISPSVESCEISNSQTSFKFSPSPQKPPLPSADLLNVMKNKNLCPVLTDQSFFQQWWAILQV